MYTFEFTMNDSSESTQKMDFTFPCKIPNEFLPFLVTNHSFLFNFKLESLLGFLFDVKVFLMKGSIQMNDSSIYHINFLSHYRPHSHLWHSN